MSKFFLLHRVGWLAVIFAALLAPRATQASHALGSDMNYTNVAPGVYYITCRFYRDCSGVSAPGFLTVNYEATGCGTTGTDVNAGSAISLTPRASQVANPYCRRQNNISQCDSSRGIPSNGYPNFNIYTYGGLLSLGSTPAETCSAWILSVVITARPDTRNLGSGTDLYTYMLLNNRDVIHDSSPAFSTVGGLQPLAVMYGNTPIRYNSSVTDDEGDSLVYSMQQPLLTYNTPIAYINGHTLGESVRLQPGTPPMHLDEQGTLEFTAGSVITGSANDMDNKFVVVIQVEAWRRINGRATLLSRVRREIAALIVSSPNGVNDAPRLWPTDSSIQVFRDNAAADIVSYGDTIYASANERLRIRIPFSDANGDSIYVEMPDGLAPVNSFIYPVQVQIGAGYSTMTSEIFWTPTAADARSQGHLFYLRISDSGCPAKANAYYPLTVMVAALRPTGLVAATAKQALIAYPNPFTADVRLTIRRTAADGTAAVQIYDAMGRLVDHLPVPVGAGLQNLTWHPSSALPAGQYIARYRGAAGQQQAVLMKQ